MTIVAYFGNFGVAPTLSAGTLIYLNPLLSNILRKCQS